MIGSTYVLVPPLAHGCGNYRTRPRVNGYETVERIIPVSLLVARLQLRFEDDTPTSSQYIGTTWSGKTLSYPPFV